MTLPIYNCIVEDNEDDQTGVYAISFVDCPANEVDFITLRQQPRTILLNKDAQKQILTGVVLKPEQLIYRQSEELGEYYIKFSANQIEKIAQKMMRTGVALRTTTHQHTTPLEGNYLTELWIVEDTHADKANALGFRNLPKGTLMCSYKIEDKQYWDTQVMTGNVRGFSLEGFFNQQPFISSNNQLNKKNRTMTKNKSTLLNRIARFLLDIEDVKKADVTQSGEPYVLFVLADGSEVYVDPDGYATLNEEQLPAGEHQLADGNLLLIDKDGQFVETKAAADTTADAQAATAPQALKKRKQYLADLTPQSADAMKAKVEEMQEAIDQLTQALKAAKGILGDTQKQVEELRKKVPSARPAVQLASNKNVADLTAAERMAVALNQTISRRK